MRIVVGITGASGALLGYRMLEVLGRLGCEAHCVLSAAAKETIRLETGFTPDDFFRLAARGYDADDVSARIASGSMPTDGMVIIPCSMKTLAAVSHGYADSLLTRAADVTLKEGRKLVLVPREMPFGRAHLLNLLAASDLGCVIVPPVLTFYNSPETLDDQITHVIGKCLRQFGLEHPDFVEWAGEA